MIYPARSHVTWCRLWGLVVVLCLPLISFARDVATVVKVFDGDTLEITLNGQTERVRLIGVDTSETFDSDKLRCDVQRTSQDEQTIKALGERASAVTNSVIHPGSQVQLEYDQQPREVWTPLALSILWGTALQGGQAADIPAQMERGVSLL
jgi:hypothetical protein